ncbi:hypothetical protein EJB05_38412, partial [Eragrostis curvula]
MTALPAGYDTEQHKENDARGCFANVSGAVRGLTLAEMPCSTMRPEELLLYRQHERAEVEKKLHEYVLICRSVKVNCDKVCIQKDDIAEGILELITSHGITKLVMGAAADKNYSKEDHAEVPAVPSSPAASNTALLPAFSISSQMRSTMIHRLENEPSSSNVRIQSDLGRSRTDLIFSPSQRTGHTLLQAFKHLETGLDDKTRIPGSSENFSIDSSRSQNSGYGSSPNGDVASISGTAETVNDDIIEVGSATHLSTNNSHEHISSSSHQLDMPKEMLGEIEFLKKEMHEECNKRRNAERELHSAFQKIKELENSYMHELKQRKTLEEIHARQRQEIEGMRKQQDESYAALYNANEQKLTLEQRISEIQLFVKDNEGKLAANKYQLEVLQANYDKMLHEKDAAIREAEELRKMNQHGVSAPPEALNTKFSLIELQKATQGFDPTLKIGEGGFGRKQPQRIAEIVEDAIEKENLHSIIHTTAGNWPFVQANQLAHIGLRCAELSRRRRPDLTVDVWRVVEPLMKAASMTARPLSRSTPTDDACIPSTKDTDIVMVDSPLPFYDEQEIMNDPYIAADGFTYEGEAIKGWLDSGHSTSPMTNLKLEHSQLVPNRALRSAILEWQQQ